MNKQTDTFWFKQVVSFNRKQRKEKRMANCQGNGSECNLLFLIHINFFVHRGNRINPQARELRRHRGAEGSLEIFIKTVGNTGSVSTLHEMFMGASASKSDVALSSRGSLRGCPPRDPGSLPTPMHWWYFFFH